MRTPNEIEQMLWKAEDWNIVNQTKYPSMTYEQGVAEALRWALNQQNEEPIEIECNEHKN